MPCSTVARKSALRICARTEPQLRPARVQGSACVRTLHAYCYTNSIARLGTHRAMSAHPVSIQGGAHTQRLLLHKTTTNCACTGHECRPSCVQGRTLAPCPLLYTSSGRDCTPRAAP